MTLNVHDQLSLLQDILDDHHEDCCSNVSEYQQIKRLVKSMMANNSITNEQLLQLLPEIYNYGRQGETAQNIDEHLATNKTNLQGWLNAIQTTSLE